MPVLVSRSSSAARTARRAWSLAFFAAVVLVVVLVVIATNEVAGAQPPVSESRSFVGLEVVTVERTVSGEGSAAAMRLGPGALLLVLVIPAGVGAVAYLLARRRGA